MNEKARLSIKQVLVIDAIARCRGYKLASEDLNITLAVLNRAIKTSEKNFKTIFFQQGWGGIEPTAHGDLAIKRCMNILTLVETAKINIEKIENIELRLLPYLRWHHLRAVNAIIQFGSVSKAAETLSINQPALSRALVTLSEYTQLKIFKRHKNGLYPTETANIFAKLFNSIEEELNSFEVELSSSNDGIVGRLAVGMLPFSGQYLVAKAFGELSDKHPNIRLMAVPGNYNMLLRALKNGEIDCIVGMLRNDLNAKGINETYIFDEYFTFVSRKDHPFHNQELNNRTLQKQKWIVAPHGTPTRQYFENYFRKLGAVPPTQTCEILSFANAEQMIINSNSIALLSYNKESLKNLRPELKKVDIAINDDHKAVGLTTIQSKETPESIKIFKKLLVDFTIGFE